MEALRGVETLLLASWTKLKDDRGFQTAEAIAIAAVGIIVLAAILAVLQVLGVDVINWLRDQFGIPSSS
jgi:hypothetical protein